MHHKVYKTIRDFEQKLFAYKKIKEIDPLVRRYRETVFRPEDGREIFRIYEFDAQGFLIRQSVEGKSTIKEQFVYEEEGKLAEKEVEEAKTGNKEISKWTYQDQNTAVQKQTEVIFDEQSIFYQEKYTFDTQGNLIQLVQIDDNDQINYDFRFEYHENGKIKRNQRNFLNAEGSDSLVEYDETGGTIYKNVMGREFILSNKKSKEEEVKVKDIFRKGWIKVPQILEEEAHNKKEIYEYENNSHRVLSKCYVQDKLLYVEETEIFEGATIYANFELYDEEENKMESMNVQYYAGVPHIFHLRYKYFPNRYIQRVDAYDEQRVVESTMYELELH